MGVYWKEFRPYPIKCGYGFFLATCCFFISLASIGQGDKCIISGRLFDSAQVKECNLAVIALLQRDSSLVLFARSKKDGRFVIHSIPPGFYTCLITHPSYADISFALPLREGEVKDLGNVILPLRSELMTAVIVTPRNVMPYMNGDTLEYNTRNLKLKVNATVEEMLRHLPGVTVDRDGNIMVNGRRIDRLTVDGEDFFSADPTIVTRNFNADMIRKVQVLDRKSKETEFTGVDDGQRTRTLNLSLKEDSKKGYFLKTETASNGRDYYNVNSTLDAFKQRRQLAAVAMAANDGRVEITGSGMNMENSPGRMVSDPLGASAGGGIPRMVSVGTHYADHWNKQDAHFTGDYQYGHLTMTPVTTNAIVQSLPGTVYTQRQQASSINNQDQHAISTELQFNLDSLHSLRIAFARNMAQASNTFGANSGSSLNDILVNSTLRHIRSDVDYKSFYANIMWLMRSKRIQGRSYSLIAEVKGKSNSAQGIESAFNSFYNGGGTLNYSDSIDQQKVTGNEELSWNIKVGALEPLWKGSFAAIGYGMTGNVTQSLLNTYAKQQGHYDLYIDSLSNRFRNRILSQAAFASLQGRYKRLMYTIGGTLTYYTNKTNNIIKDSSVRQQYVYLLPMANIRYDLDANKGFSLEYKGNFTPPSITQLQPIRNNNDPVHVFLGNPDLHPTNSHYFELKFHKMQPMMIEVGGRLEVTSNAFSTISHTDTLGRQLTQTVNVQGALNTGIFALLSRRIEGLGLQTSLSPYWYYYKSINYVDVYLSHNSSHFAGAALSMNKYMPNKYNIEAGCHMRWESSHSSVNPLQATHYWTQEDNLGLSVFFLQGCELNMTARYTWRQQANNLDKQPSILLWNGYISRNFLSNRLAVRWSINDILGQNVGMSRTINSNTITESTYQVLGRYWMLAATYRFTHHRRLSQ